MCKRNKSINGHKHNTSKESQLKTGKKQNASSRLSVLDNGDVAVILNGNDLLGLRARRERRVEDLLELFEGTANGLDTEQIPEDSLDAVPSDEDEDILVLDVLESDGAGELVDESEQVDDNTVHGHTLRAGGGLQALDRVERLERGVCERVDDVEEEVGRDSALADTKVLRVIGHLRPAGGQSTVDGKPDGRTKCTPDEHLATGHAIGEGDTGESASARDDRGRKVEYKLHVVVVADGSVDLRVEVTKTIS